MAEEILTSIKEAEIAAKKVVDDAMLQAEKLVLTAKQTAVERADYEMSQCQREAQEHKIDTEKIVEQEKLEFDEQTKEQSEKLRKKLSAHKQSAADAVIHLVTDA